MYCFRIYWLENLKDNQIKMNSIYYTNTFRNMYLYENMEL